MPDENIKESDIENKVVVRKNDFMRMDRRTFVKLAGAAAGAMALGGFGFPSKLLAQAAAQGAPLSGNKIPQFVDALPDLLIQGGASHTLEMNEFLSPVMPSTFVPAVGPYLGTYVWGYRYPGQDNAGNPVYPYVGPVIIATRKTATQMTYINNLGFADPAGTTGTKVAAWTNATDQTLHWANPLNAPMNTMTNYTGYIPAVVHLHGGEVPPVLDGGPDAWYTSDGVHSGHGYYTFGQNQGDPAPGNYAVYKYPNSQEAANIWFHDHALGITRLNVYAGLAGAYIIDDPAVWVPAAPKPPLIPLVIQDRMFDVNGQLFFPNLGINPEHPFWIPEFVGDTIVVNGKVWPFKAVDRQRYRLLLLNGSNARAYDLSLIDRISGVRGPRMWVIGTDGGYLDTPVLIDPNAMGKAAVKSLVIMPGERYEVIIDFNDPVWSGLITAAYAGMAVPNPLNLELQNTAKTPFPNGAPAPKNTTGRIMRFSVSTTVPADPSYNPDPTVLGGGGPLRTPMKRLVNPIAGTPAAGVVPVVKRQLTLNEVMGPGGPLEILVNNTKWSGKSSATDKFTNGVRPDFLAGSGDTYYSEVPKEGDTEQWEIINLTADAHPIHLHLVQFQLMNRQNFDVKGYNAAYAAAFPGSTAAIDPMTGVAGIPAGMYIPMFGPPYNYKTGQALTAPDVFSGNPLTTFTGGNPDVTQFLAMKKGVPVISPPLPHEAGWKDTVIMYPGQVTRIMVRWAPTDVAIGDTANEHFPFNPNGGHGFVWHCHIIDHEDNEMMRPNTVDPKGSTTNPGSVSRTYTDY